MKFLLTDWERLPGFGIGAQIVGMTGLLAIAINEGRVLVTNYYNRADHGGCKGKFLVKKKKKTCRYSLWYLFQL